VTEGIDGPAATSPVTGHGVNVYVTCEAPPERIHPSTMTTRGEVTAASEPPRPPNGARSLAAVSPALTGEVCYE
jgi:hypothetical protein